MSPLVGSGSRPLVLAWLLIATSAVALAEDAGDGSVSRARSAPGALGKNLLAPEGWNPWDKGVQMVGNKYCRARQQRRPEGAPGASRRVALNQKVSAPIIERSSTMALANQPRRSRSLSPC